MTRLFFVYSSCDVGAGDRRSGPDVGGESLVVFGKGAEVALNLNAVPELRRLTEEGSEADRHGRSNGAASVDDLVDGARGDADGPRHGILGDAHRNEIFFQEDFARCDGWIHR